MKEKGVRSPTPEVNDDKSSSKVSFIPANGAMMEEFKEEMTEFKEQVQGEMQELKKFMDGIESNLDKKVEF